MNRNLFSAMLVLGISACGIAVFFMMFPGAEFGVSKTNATIFTSADGFMVYITRGDLLNQIFREPFETSIMIFDDYTYVTWSNHLDGSIFGGASERFEYLESIGLSANQVIAFIHNHPTPAGPSPGDLDFLHDLRRYGYAGKYGIYYPFGKKLLWMEK